MASVTYSRTLLRTLDLQKGYITDNKVLVVTVIYYAYLRNFEYKFPTVLAT
jgi:hypothetical protein